MAPIDVIRSLLVEQSLVDGSRDTNINLLLTRSDCVVAEVTGGKAEEYFLKFSAVADLHAEHSLINTAYSRYPEFVPRTLGYHQRAGLNIIVMERVHFRPVRSRIIGDFRYRKRHRAISEFLSRQCSSGNFDEQALPTQKLITLTKRHLMQKRLPDPLDDAVVEELLALDRCPQHGDFVHNNIGFGPSRTYVFDWEDYGKVNLPGLDLFTFIASELEFSQDALCRLLSAEGPEFQRFNSFIEEVCREIPISSKQFYEFMPTYAALFSYLKSGYGRRIQNATNAVLSRLA